MAVSNENNCIGNRKFVIDYYIVKNDVIALVSGLKKDRDYRKLQNKPRFIYGVLSFHPKVKEESEG